MIIAILECRLAQEAKRQFNENAGKLSGNAADLWAEINIGLKRR